LTVANVRGRVEIGECGVLGGESSRAADAHSRSSVDGGRQDGLGSSREDLEELSDVAAGIRSPLIGSGRLQGGAARAREAGTLAVVESEVRSREIGDGEAVRAYDVRGAGNVGKLR